ncbi:MAG: hypothetical protein JNK02_04815 [Planctomycetes bacterium]|nr:hypothetical protein [Planctomycetota bacterium]
MLRSLALLTVATLALAPRAAAGVGDTPSYTFRQPPVNAMGVKSLEDLRGKPVLVDFWGTR